MRNSMRNFAGTWIIGPQPSAGTQHSRYYAPRHEEAYVVGTRRVMERIDSVLEAEECLAP
jgi:hypothetical protein